MILLKTLSSRSTLPRPLLLQRTLLSSLPQQQQETPKPKTLSSLFAKPDTKPGPKPDKPPPKPIKRREEFKRKKKESVLRYGPMEEKEPPKELSPDAASLLARLTEDGYLKDANFLKGKEEELEAAAHRVHVDYYARSFYRLAAERFGSDHQQEIAQWLSGKDLKTIALFGCPSIERKSVFAAKRLRSFFHIHEDNVCQTCKLCASCHFKNQKVGAVDKVILGDVMRLIMVYTLNSVPKVLSIPDNLKCSVEKVLKEVIRLCG